MMGSHRIEELLQGRARARMVVREQAARDVREALLHDAVLRVHAQRDALDDAERPQDQRKVGGDLQATGKPRWLLEMKLTNAATAAATAFQKGWIQGSPT